MCDTTLITHPGNIPQLPEVAKLGGFVEITASFIYRTPAGAAAAVSIIRKVGGDHVIVSTDCGQTTNLYPTDCLVVAARELRARGVTQREIDLMYKVNPATLLGLSPPAPDAVLGNRRRRGTRARRQPARRDIRSS